MGAAESIRAAEEDDDSEEEDEEEKEHAEDGDGGGNRREIDGDGVAKKVLEQEPEMLPYHSSASPLSPQPSSLGTPRLGPSIKVWDPYNVLVPPPPPPPPAPFFSRSYSLLSPRGIADEDRTFTEVFLISHGECDLNLRPDLVGGRCHTAALTPSGMRQARALAAFLKSSGIRFNAVYSSPLSRSRSMAVTVCQEMKFADEQIQLVDELTEISMGHWEGCPSSEIYTPEITSLIESSQPDFSAPSGESLRQVEFRMLQFLNHTILRLPEKLQSDFLSHHQTESQAFYPDRDPHSLHWDAAHRHQQPGLSRKRSGKSRLQYVTTTEGEDEISPTELNHRNSVNLSMRSSSASVSSCIGVFTHCTPIKCLLTGILGCSPLMCHKICVEDSSVTVLQHSWRTGWQIKRLNDTAHLRLM